MARKVKCKMCEKSMRWAIPERVTENNYEYAKHCLRMVKNTLVCDRTMRTKYIEHEQYCKYFRKKDERELDYDIKAEPKRIQKLEDMIKEYERKVGLTCRK